MSALDHKGALAPAPEPFPVRAPHRDEGAAAAGRKLHLACYLPDMSGGGVERMRLHLLARLRALGVQTSLVLSRGGGALEAGLPPDLPVTVLGTRRTAADVPRLARHLRSNRPDVVLSSLGHNNVAALAAKLLSGTRTRVILCQHNTLSHEARRGGSYAALPGLLRLLAPVCSGIVAVSEGVADDLAHITRIPRERITVIPNPVITASFARDASCRVDDPWFEPGVCPVYVTAGRLVAQKDHSTLLRAFALHRRMREARLLILGEGPRRPALEAEARALGIAPHVRFMGFVANPLPYFRRASAFVLSSLHEGFGNVIVEALACGTPVISTDCPHGPAEILENGRLGVLVSPGDHVALARALDPALRVRFPRSVLKAGAARYTVERAADAYLDLARPFAA